MAATTLPLRRCRAQCTGDALDPPLSKIPNKTLSLSLARSLTRSRDRSPRAQSSHSFEFNLLVVVVSTPYRHRAVALSA